MLMLLLLACSKSISTHEIYRRGAFVNKRFRKIIVIQYDDFV